MSLRKRSDPERGDFWPQGHYVNNLGKCPQDKTKCQMSNGLDLLVSHEDF